LTVTTRRQSLRRLAAWSFSATAASALTGCATWTPPQQAALRQATPTGLPRRVHHPELPFVGQPGDDLCGPAVLAMLLRAAGRPADLGQLTSQVYLPGRQGTLQAEMLAGARRHGLLGVELPPQLAAVFTEVAAGRPVAVLLNLGLAWWPRWHHAVLVGYDLDSGEVWLHSGQQADARWSLVTFEHTWARSGHWAFVALPPGQLPEQVDEATLVRALLGLDRTLPAAQVVPAWQAATRRWPANDTLAMVEGNALLAAGEARAAAERFASVAARSNSAAAWNNLAAAWLQAGERAKAREAAHLAVQRARTHEPRWLAVAQQTLQETEAP
jgi:hypothetical protein